MKKVLIISPHFPPVNAPDMHRVRMSLPYFKQLGWEPTLLTIHAEYIDFPRDPLLLEGIPDDLRILKVHPGKRRFGINGLALRSLFPLYRQGKALLEKEHFDLVYFSTTMFPLPLLGYFWKKWFGVPYVIDMQDPWYSTYYDNKPSSQRPPKHWFSNRLHKYAEPLAMKSVDGIISVSPAYIRMLTGRYPRLNAKPMSTIPFSASMHDVDTALKDENAYPLQFDPADGYRHLVYIGRAGHVMQKSLNQLFTAFQLGMRQDPKFYGQFRMHFIGTDYATGNRAKLSVLPLAEKYGLSEIVSESTERIPFFSVTAHLKKANGILVPGSDDAGYTASKIYPYLLLEKPLLGIFHAQSPVVEILSRYRTNSVSLIGESPEKISDTLLNFLKKAEGNEPEKNAEAVWEASAMARKQVELFNKVIHERP